MAEMAVSFAVDQLLPLLREETKLLRGIHKEFADIKVELECIQAFLKDADKRAAAAEGDDANEGVKFWVKQVREAAFRIEDIIDDYLILVRQQPHDPGCVAILHKIGRLLKTMVPRHRIASEIQDIKLHVRGIKERSERYDFQIQPSTEQGSSILRGSQNTKWHDPRMDALYIDEAEIVGFHAPKNKLIGWLVEGRAERTVISIVGMGGLGKTTLAIKVFDSKEVTRHFECRVWITVSQSYTTEELLRAMLKKLYEQKGDSPPPQDIPKMDRGSLISELRNYLRRKRYVFVFDDVWDILFWDEIEHALIDNKNGSKIFITTRNRDVAMYCKKSSFIEVHELQPLTNEQSLELFNKKAFRFDFDGCCPKELIDISFEIVRKCKGLPLAIVTIGGLLSTKEKNAFEWQRFCENMPLELTKDSHLVRINKILSLSYNDLPLYLKSCLLYFGIYPEDYKVESKRLIRQWLAEGFVKEERGKTLEEVAEGYLTELIQRSLVHVSSIGIEGKAKRCCVHDLVRVMIIEKSDELSFCNHINKDGHSSLSGITRRISLATIFDDSLACIENSHVRSVFLFTNESKCLKKYFVSRIFTEHSHLKVLDFQGSELRTFHDNLGSLIHLRYLSFKDSIIILKEDKLSKSIGMMLNLETLDLRSSYIPEKPKQVSKRKRRTRYNVQEIPNKLSQFRRLRHLLCNNMPLSQLVGAGVGELESLQTLSEVWIDMDEIKFIRELGKLWQLRKLSLYGVKREYGSALSLLLNNEMRHLEKLRIGLKEIARPVRDVIDLHLVSPPPMLRSLKLCGKLEKFSEWICKLRNLVKLKITNSELSDDPIKFLEKMSNLLSLSITFKSYEGESLHFHDGGFQNLKELYIRDLPNLNSLVMDKGALHSLKKLELSNISNLKTVTSGIRYLENFEVLNLRNVPNAEWYPTGGISI